MQDANNESRKTSASVRGHAAEALAPSTKKQKTSEDQVDAYEPDWEPIGLPQTPASVLESIVAKIEAEKYYDQLGLAEGDVEPALCTLRNMQFPTRGSGPDLLLYTLTDAERYNGAANALRERLESKPLLVHGLSGAGKTRALLDILANNNDLEYGLYFDFGNMASGRLPDKNFSQADVGSMRKKFMEHEGPTDNARAGLLVRSLILARAVVLHVLKKRGWKQSHLLYAQLGTGPAGQKLLKFAEIVFSHFVKRGADEILSHFDCIDSSLLVVIDEANIALDGCFGSFDATSKENKQKGDTRPLMSPLYEVLKETKSVLAGTNMSFGNVVSTVVSQMAEKSPELPFNNFTTLNQASQLKALAFRYFGLEGDMEDAYILKGRCRFFMLAIRKWLTDPDMGSFAAAIAEASANLQDVEDPNSPHASIQKFVTKYKDKRALLKTITDDLLTSFIGGENALVYQPNKELIVGDAEAINEVVDMSIATTTTSTYRLALREPVVAFGLISILGKDNLWKPADTMLTKMCQDQNQNPSMMGFMFEYVVACLLIPNFAAVMQHLQKQEKFAAIPDWVLQLSRPATTHFVVTNIHYQEFCEAPQVEKVCFPPSKPSGPDVLAWLKAIMQGSLEQALVSVQCKLYKDELTNGLTNTALATLDKAGKDGQRSVRILFTGNGDKGQGQPVGIAGDTVTIKIKIEDIAGLPAVSQIKTVYVAKYGHSLEENLAELDVVEVQDKS